MKEHPILMNGAMVRAVLDGGKTQTRRVAKFKPRAAGCNLSFSAMRVGHYMTGNPGAGFVLHSGAGDRTFPLICPYGQPGDRIWVRETFSDVYGAGGDEDRRKKEVMYRANGETDPYVIGGRWTPSIHMPRWASRILLEIVSVRVERLNDCCEADALAEGVKAEPCDHVRLSCEEIGCCGPTAKGMYAALWDQINGAGAWAANPWVWVVEFKRVTP